MEVLITDAAINDLVAIADYIRPHNPDRAASFVAELLDQCESLAEFPRRYPLVPRYEHHGIRRRAYADYLIFYRIGPRRIEVIHIVNGARDMDALLFPRPET